jgi:hypothetical protein
MSGLFVSVIAERKSAAIAVDFHDSTERSPAKSLARPEIQGIRR